MPNDNRPTVDAINTASENVPVEIDKEKYISQLEGLVVDLQTDLDSVHADLARMGGKKTIAEEKAELVKPYANNLFYFMCFYCIVVGAFLFMSGVKSSGFSLSDTVLSILAGSTALAVIGLVSVVVTGIFSNKE